MLATLSLRFAPPSLSWCVFCVQLFTLGLFKWAFAVLFSRLVSPILPCTHLPWVFLLLRAAPHRCVFAGCLDRAIPLCDQGLCFHTTLDSGSRTPAASSAWRAEGMLSPLPWQVRLPSLGGKLALVPWADMLNHRCEVRRQGLPWIGIACVPRAPAFGVFMKHKDDALRLLPGVSSAGEACGSGAGSPHVHVLMLAG